MSQEANEALRTLVQQFSDQSAFVRELIQNAIDAGAGRIEVRMSERKGCLQIDVEDDGEGMDQEVIETYLLTLFRSSKEKDLTKIGKFGIGFVSLFALSPEVVMVNTGRDGRFYRVVFDTDRDYTLAEVDEPIEGTTVSIYVRAPAQKRKALAREIRDATHYWCRYASTEIWTSCSAFWGWPPTEVHHAFTVASPVQVEVQEEGLRASLGLSASPTPAVGYYNHGLTLLEAEEAVIPGVTFRVEASLLEHTLTRDNVMRDRNYRTVMRRLRELAQGPLRQAYHRALREAIAAKDWDRHAVLLGFGHLEVVAVPLDLPCIRTVDGGLVTPGSLRPGLVKRMFGNELLYAEKPSPLSEALRAQGRTVLLGHAAPDPGPGVQLAARVGGGTPLDIHQRWILPEILPADPLVTAVAEGVRTLPAWRPCLPARFTDRGDALCGRIASWQQTPGVLEHRGPDEGQGPPPDRATILINVAHPVVARMKAVPVTIAAPLLRQVVRRALQLPGDLDEAGMRLALDGGAP